MRFRTPVSLACLAISATLGAALAVAEPKAEPASNPSNSKAKAEAPEKPNKPEKPDKIVPLNKEGTVLLDVAGNRVLLKAKVVLREGTLEMLCCLKQTKEHESILSIGSKAYPIHAGLLALGAEQGKPVQFVPEYKPATGQWIEVFLQWTDEQGKLQRVPAQSWVRNVTRRFFAEKLAKLPPEVKLTDDSDLRYDDREKELFWYGPMTDSQRDDLLALSKDQAYRRAIQSIYDRGQSREMKAHWIFSGSKFDEINGKRAYLAEMGDLICVANFPTATLDVSMQSGQGNDDLVFEAYTERIPPVGTDVTIELIPVFDKAGKPVLNPPVVTGK